MLAIVTDGDDGDLGLLDESDQLLDAPSVRPSHPIHLVHDNQLLLETAAAAAAALLAAATLFAAAAAASASAFGCEIETLAVDRTTHKNTEM